MKRLLNNPIRILFILTLMIVIIGVTAPPCFAQREIDPAGDEAVIAAGLPHGTVDSVTVRTKTKVSFGTSDGLATAPAAELTAPAVATQPIAGGPAIWTNGSTIYVSAEYGLPWHWNHAGGSDGLPRIAMRLVGDHYEVDLGRVPAEDFTFGFTDRNQSADQRETRWLPGNVGFRQGSSWVIPHANDPGCDLLMRANGQQMWVANPDEVAAARRAKVAGR